VQAGPFVVRMYNLIHLAPFTSEEDAVRAAHARAAQGACVDRRASQSRPPMQHARRRYKWRFDESVHHRACGDTCCVGERSSGPAMPAEIDP